MQSSSVHHRCEYGSENSHRTRTRSNCGCTVKGKNCTRFVHRCTRYTVSGITPYGSQQPAQLLLFYTILYMYCYTYTSITTTQCAVRCTVFFFWFINSRSLAGARDTQTEHVGCSFCMSHAKGDLNIIMTTQRTVGCAVLFFFAAVVRHEPDHSHVHETHRTST
jgi:hypothetical protein